MASSAPTALKMSTSSEQSGALSDRAATTKSVLASLGTARFAVSTKVSVCRAKPVASTRSLSQLAVIAARSDQVVGKPLPWSAVESCHACSAKCLQLALRRAAEPALASQTSYAWLARVLELCYRLLLQLSKRQLLQFASRLRAACRARSTAVAIALAPDCQGKPASPVANQLR